MPKSRPHTTRCPLNRRSHAEGVQKYQGSGQPSLDPEPAQPPINRLHRSQHPLAASEIESTAGPYTQSLTSSLRMLPDLTDAYPTATHSSHSPSSTPSLPISPPDSSTTYVNTDHTPTLTPHPQTDRLHLKPNSQLFTRRPWLHNDHAHPATLGQTTINRCWSREGGHGCAADVTPLPRGRKCRSKLEPGAASRRAVVACGVASICYRQSYDQSYDYAVLGPARFSLNYMPTCDTLDVTGCVTGSGICKRQRTWRFRSKLGFSSS